MKKLLIQILILLSPILCIANSNAKWITVPSNNVNDPNTWIAFRKDVLLNKKPKEAKTKIAVDSKYWLWINGNLVIFEGGLKRGPNPNDSYYDEVDLAPYLTEGENKIAILLWHFGKDGFSHKNSGKAGLLFDMQVDGVRLLSDASWRCKIHPAFEDAGAPYPNFRLPEANIRYNANSDLGSWQTDKNNSFDQAVEIGVWGDAPWNKLVKRIIPQWKDFGIKPLAQSELKRGLAKDTLVYKLPYNMQMTPILDLIDHKGNQEIELYTDNTYAAGDVNIRAEYITKKGIQSYESIGWMNGHKLFLVVPHGVDIHQVSYRETGYNSEVIGTFSCDSEFYMKFWDKALRTLYVNMRDTFYDCPERERAQWWGDAVLLMAECFYTHSHETHALMKKSILELIAWQKPNGVIYSPIPSGNWTNELPGQMLASVGWYGFWNYYMNTGDLETIKTVYPGVKKYLGVWSLDETGLTAFRSGDWTWGDWGDNKDIRLIFAGWHYLALRAAKHMAKVTGNTDDIAHYEQQMEQIKIGYNKCWNGAEYRHPDYKDQTDDRVHALAILCGIADSSKYEEILEVFRCQQHASPYMEKYVMEALIVMGQGEFAMQRAKARYDEMVNDDHYTTLFEGWGIGERGFGGGTVNHAWSGGPLINIAQYICGIYPIEPAYKVFKIEPTPVYLKEVEISVPSIVGNIKSHYILSENKFELSISVPKNSTAVVYLPNIGFDEVLVNGKNNLKKYAVNDQYKHESKVACQFNAGDYKIMMR